MSVKKAFIGVIYIFYKIVRFLLIAVPLIMIARLFLRGGVDALNALLGSITDIIFIAVGIVIYSLILGRINRRIYILKNSLKSMTNSLYTSETDIVGMLGNQATSYDNQNFFPVSFPVEQVSVRVYRDAEENLNDYKTFDFDYTSKTNPLLEKELFMQLERVLQSRGMTRAKENPQAIISMDFFIGKKEQYTPPTTVTNTELKYVWNAGMVGWNMGGFTSAVPVTKSYTTSGYTTVSYYSNVRLNFLNHAKLVIGEKLEIPPLIWLGEAESEGFNPDIRGISSVMFNELMEHFSNQSADSSKCNSRHFRYGGLGLGFNSLNWQVISYVEPFSIATEQGIKPGDVLMKINGKRVGNWPVESYGHSRNSWPYTSKDPYFQDILSNPGRSDVELVIQSAGTGLLKKIVTLKLRPRNMDRYVSWKPQTK